MHTTCRTRGAARHWIIGCLSVLVVVIIALGAGGYFLFNKVKENISWGTFEVAAKSDPPLTADLDTVLPLVVGDYARQSIKTEASFTVPGVETESKSAPSSATLAIYQSPDRKQISVYAIKTAEANDGDHNSHPAETSGSETKSKSFPSFGFPQQMGQDSTKGYQFGTTFGAVPMDISLWSKPNWTYMIQTTDTKSLDFAKLLQEPAK